MGVGSCESLVLSHGVIRQDAAGNIVTLLEVTLPPSIFP